MCQSYNRSGSLTCPRRHSCARSRSLQSHSLLYPYPLSERALTVRGALITAVRAGPIAVSTRSSSAELPCRGSADFASRIHSQLMPLNREGAIGEAFSLFRKSHPSRFHFLRGNRRRTASLANAAKLLTFAVVTLLGPLFSQPVSGASLGGNPPNW